MGKEKNFENRVKKWLREQGCYVIKYYGCGNTKAGIPDLLICANGRFVGVELKSEYGIVSELQKVNMHRISESGGASFILRPSDFENFKEYIMDVMNEC